MTLDRNNCNTFAIGRCALAIVKTGQQKTFATATETLSIVATGRVRYEAFDSPVYLGGVPESSTAFLVAGGALALMAWKRRHLAIRSGNGETK